MALPESARALEAAVAAARAELGRTGAISPDAWEAIDAAFDAMDADLAQLDRPRRSRIHAWTRREP